MANFSVSIPNHKVPFLKNNHPFLFLFLLISLSGTGQGLQYPETISKTVYDTIFETILADDYRWLENIDDVKTKEWINAQNKFTEKALRKPAGKCNSYHAIDKYAYTKYENPIRQGDYYFTYAYYNNVSLPALFYQKAINDSPSIIVDPNFISSSDNILLKGYSVSGDSKLLAYQFSRNGSDWGEIKVVNLRTGSHRNDHLKRVKFSGISWKDDGFYYSTFPEQGLEATSDQEVFYHKLGTDQSDDELIFRRKGNPTAFFSVMTTSDERFFVLTEKDEIAGHSNIFYIDYATSPPALKPLITRLAADEHLNIIDNQGDRLIATSFKENNNGMIVMIDPSNPRSWNILVPEYDEALLLEVKMLEDKLIAVYQSNQKQIISFFDYQGKMLDAIRLGFGFSAGSFNCEKNDKKILFSYSGYTQPPVVYILDTETFDMKPLRQTVVNFDFTLFETKELEYKSKDGTKVPLLMVYHKDIDLTTPNPLLLKAYGGFGSVATPAFSPGIVHFLMNNGIFAFANIRGGGDKGKAWALAGKGKNKQTSFDDFIAAAEYLITNNYTSSDKLAITGASNGGLVVGAVITQRPELFKAAVPIVAPMDMIRFEKFTIGHLHTDEYGSVSDSAGFIQLLAYSPLQNVVEGKSYPAMLIMTSENDDRVPPFHSYKFAARLQNLASQKNMVLLRTEQHAGHYGAEGSFKTHLREEADMYDFILYHLLYQ
jgi:prolyl oligopeptidase